MAEGWAETPEGTGPRIAWNLDGEPLPVLPLPNDIATWPDPTSPTGRRINVSQVAPTGFERLTRELFDRVDGWGTYAAITLPFDEHIDAEALFEAQGGGSHAFSASPAGFQRHAIYLVNMETGEPIPLDVNSGNFHYVLDSPSQYWRNDPHAGESNLLFETLDEDTNGNGVLDPLEDLDYDGVLDEPNTFDGRIDDPMDAVDEMTWFYDRQDKTVVLRPILPMRPRTEYAVVVTDRLVGPGGQSVRSPFEYVHHLSQREELEALPEHFQRHPEIYGDLATRGWGGVAFAWTFTTQSITEDLDTLRAGLYGEGVFARLADEFPPDYTLAPMQGGVRCPEPGSDVFIAPGERFTEALEGVAGLALGLDEAQVEQVLASYDSLSHVVVTFFESPFLLGDPETTGLEDTWEMDWQTGEARIDRETISMILFVPKESEAAAQPFPVAFYVHGYGSASAEPLPFAGYMLQNGIAAAAVNAEGHGVPLDSSLISIIGTLFRGSCLEPSAPALLAGRAEDIDGDGAIDSGVNFWTAYLFHTRDVVRQTVLDHMRAIQLLRSFDGREANAVVMPEALDEDGLAYDADTFDYEGPDIAGDFDGDGVPDVGGPDQEFLFTGGSLGGIVSGVVAGSEPAVRAAAPIVGAGGLTDVGSRLDLGSVLSAMHLRLMGPFVIVEPSERRGEDNTACAEGERSVYFLATDRNSRAEVEFACVDGDLLDDDAVIVVHNAQHEEISCASATGGEAGAYRVPFPADPGDRITVEIFADARADYEFGHCAFLDGVPRTADLILDSFENGADACRRCAKFQSTEWNAGDPLVSPAMGFGNQRQSPDLRRLMMLAQAGLDPADPVNYARRVFLEPVGAADSPARPTNLLVANSIGDQSVPVSAGNAYARAAGVLAFLPPDAPEHLREWRAPASFEGLYPGHTSPNDLLIATHVLEGVDRLGRHPGEGRSPNFLFDIDNVSGGRQLFSEDGRRQMVDGFPAPTLERPLRWTRASRPMAAGGEEAVWTVLPGDDVSGLLNYYAIPTGVHGFDEIVYRADVPWNTSQYIINLIARWGATGGQDLRYHTDPNGHECLENSTCDFLPSAE